MQIHFITLSGVSNAGKTAIANDVLSSTRLIRRVLSTTTRVARPNDPPGEYEHITEAEFHELEEGGAFLWRAQVRGFSYATKKSTIDAVVASSELGLMVLKPDTVRDLKAYLPKGVWSLYIPTPPREMIVQRGRDRGDTLEVIERDVRECANWDAFARQSHLFNQFLPNNGHLSIPVSEVFQLVQRFKKITA